MIDPIFCLRGLAVSGAAVAMVTDLWKGRIYNWLTFPMVTIGWVANAWLFGLSGLGHSIAATFLGFILFFGFALFGVIGMGDVKLLGGIGALAGCKFVICAFLLCNAVGIPHALLIQYLNFGRNAPGMLFASFTSGAFLKKTIDQENQSKRYKFYLGVDILIGCILAWILNLQIIWW